jgi:choice-of-anchor B domain-containing protein
LKPLGKMPSILGKAALIRASAYYLRLLAGSGLALGWVLGVAANLSAHEEKDADRSAPPVPGEIYHGGAGGGPFAARNIDLLAHMPLNTLGAAPDAMGNDIWGWTDPTTAREYVLLGRSDGTAFIDVSSPTNPVYLGSLPSYTGTSVWRGIKVYADRAYIVSDRNGSHGVQVFDLTQLRGVTAPTTFSEIPAAHYAGVTSAHNIAINEQSGFAYVAGSDRAAGGLHILDIRQTVPTLAGEFSADGYTHDVQVVNYHGPDAGHAGREIAFAANEDTLTIVDVTNKSAPALLARTGYPEHGYAHQGWLTEDHSFFLMDDEYDGYPPHGGTLQNPRTHIWDVSDLDAPLYKGFFSGATFSNDHNLYIRGNFVFESNYTSGLRVFDISQIAEGVVREVAFLDTYPPDDATTFDGTWGNYPFFNSGTIAVSDRQYGLLLARLKLAGDANDDSRVDRWDTAILARNFGRDGGTSWADGDFDGNGRVDLADMALLTANFSTGVAAASAVVVPEPASGGLTLLAVALLWRVCRRNRPRPQI